MEFWGVDVCGLRKTAAAGPGGPGGVRGGGRGGGGTDNDIVAKVVNLFNQTLLIISCFKVYFSYDIGGAL